MSKKNTGAIYDARLIRRLWVYVAPHQRWLWTALGLLVVTSAFGLVRPWLFKLALDDFIGPNQMDNFGWLLAGTAVAVLGELVCRSLQAYALEVAGQNALLDLRRAVFRHMQRLSASFFDRTPIGKLIGRITTDIESLHEMFASGVVTVLGDVINLAVILVILFWMNWELTLITLTVVPVLFGLTLWVRLRVRSAYSVMISKRSALNAYLHEQATGMPLTQAFRRQEHTRATFDGINHDMCEAQLKTVWWESLLSAGTEMLSSVTIALIVWYGGGLALEGMGLDSGSDRFGEGVTIGTLAAFLQYMERFFGPLNDLSLKYTVMQNAMTASDRIFNLMDQDDFTPEVEVSKTPAVPTGSIRFDNVTFGYGKDHPVIRDLSFEVAAGERVAFVGATGAGKSTILKLLTRLYDVDSGSIEIDGVDVREYDLKSLRTRVGIVPQDVFLFAGDVIENIRLGHPEIDVAAARRAADELHIDEVIKRLPGGYNEPVRERGSNLSAGERQLIAFARVLAVAPKLLALDEATSNVDSHMEHLLQGAVARVMKGRTCIIIAHRLSTIRDVDRILVMHKGKLVEEGSHDELLAKGGFYWKLHNLQYSA
ncbi:MAG: ATP-binding cassette subfamily B multidrug efflux pump [Planctomycetota bacterium]